MLAPTPPVLKSWIIQDLFIDEFGFVKPHLNNNIIARRPSASYAVRGFTKPHWVNQPSY
jgi:hypothetical protein